MPRRSVDFDHKVVCDITGAIVKASRCRMTWDGKLVLNEVWSPRHPQETLPPVMDDVSIVNARPEQPDVFIDATSVTGEDL